ncbi:hypothetical protein FSARC_780 [Fusarium sarcochroum]|uniref:Nephrocystin 3-like N-terminal domain-containing protein n=1 Tax=Fusarium sarcochroum TaxID=1208366 RepID=A0A8H4UAQ3_9HYPO|nr:hypothetical protein FSARC_780 [Fusarium sarcochroum]
MSAVTNITTALSPDVRLIKVVSEFGAGLDDKYRPIFKTWQTLTPPLETDVIRAPKKGISEAKPPEQKIAIGYLSYFEKVSLLLMRLGHSTVVQRDRMQLFPNDPDLKTFTCEYLIIVVEICKQVTSPDKYRRHYHPGNLPFWSESKRRLAEDWRIQVLRQLSPHQDKFESTWRRERRKGSVEWVFNHQRYINWKSGSSSSTLLLHGPLGSGKTVTMANITAKFWPSLSTPARLIDLGQYAVALFFCQFLDQETIRPRTLLGSIAHQFLRLLKLPVDHPAILNYSRESTANDTDSIVDYIKMHFPRNHHYYLVLDGLDELSIDDACEILQPLASLQTHFLLHVCCSVRTESCIRRMASQTLMKAELISMSSVEKDKEIESYIEGELLRRIHAQRLGETTQKLIRDTLVVGAQGMYLWVVLQLDSLFPLYGQTVTTSGDFAHILSRLPTKLFETFEAALERIQDQRYGSRIFELVAAAKRPLTKNELRTALNIEPGVPVWNPNTLPLDPDALIYCCSGGLLQIDEEEGTVHFMHHSALRHVLTDSQEEEEELIEEGVEETIDYFMGQSQSGVDDAKEVFENDWRDPAQLGIKKVDYQALDTSESSQTPQKGHVSESYTARSREKHRYETFLFSSHQADTTIGYISMACLLLEQHDRRVRQSKRLVVNEKTRRMISTAVVPESLLSRFMITILQPQINNNNSNYQTSWFDIARIMEDLSVAQVPIGVGEGHLFYNYAETHWLDHTSRSCFDPNDELDFHDLFVKLVHDNPPGLLFSWDRNRHSGGIVAWAQSAYHFRLLYELLCTSNGLDCRNIVQTFCAIPLSQSSGFLCHDSLPADILCRFLIEDCCNVAGVETLLSLGALPNEQSKDESWKGWTPLQLAIQRMKEERHYEVDVVRCLLHAGADVGGTHTVPPPILSVIRDFWGAGYQLLFAHGARVAQALQGAGGGRTSLHLAGLDLAMFRGSDADEMIQDMVDCGASVKDYFKQQRWPVSFRSQDDYLYRPLVPYVFSGEDDDWVSVEDASPKQRHYHDVEDPAQADIRVLYWLCRTKCNVNIASVNGITPLGLAVESSDARLVQCLLKAGANPNLPYILGHLFSETNRPLLTAGRKGNEKIVRLLICYGASLHKVLDGDTILSLTVKEFEDYRRPKEHLSPYSLGSRLSADRDHTHEGREVVDGPPLLNTLLRAIAEYHQDYRPLNDLQQKRLGMAKDELWRELRKFLSI